VGRGAVLDVGPGSPTGVTFGTGAKFPAKYQRAFFAADWTYGTLHAIHLSPDGASFRAVKEEFIAGKPLPLTDLVINPRDGAMYFAVGGRRTQAALYRVTYVGKESTAAVAALPPTPEAKLRHSLETLHGDDVSGAALDTAWPHLGSTDPFVRYAARVAVEKQAVRKWTERALADRNPGTAIEAMIALARMGDKSLQPRLLDALGRFSFAALPAELRLPLLRAWQLTFTRMGKPDPARCAHLVAQFDPLFPHNDSLVNRELVALLIYRDSSNVVGKAVPLLSIAEPIGSAPDEKIDQALLTRNDIYGRVVQDVGSSRSDRQQITYAYALRNATTGWTPKLRLEYFSWFTRTRGWKGGTSFGSFIEKIRTDALVNVLAQAERASLDALSKAPPPAFNVGTINPKGPGRAYTVNDAAAVMVEGLQARDFVRGKALFSATACLVCHRFNGEGGGVGPDISGAGNRYTLRDLLESIIDPSLVISDQYASEQIDRREGSTIVGRVVGEEHGELLVVTNPFMPSEMSRVKTTAVKSRKPYPVSMMPPGLVNALNEEELKDLVAYILSGGNPGDKMFNATR
jgi:putative heme-binding domain-containing protein